MNCLVRTLYQVFNSRQAFLFFSPFLGNRRGNRKKTYFAFLGFQVFLLARGSHHKVEVAEKLGKRVNKSERSNPRPTMTTIS